MKIAAGTIRVVVVICSAIPFLFFWHRPWVHAAVLAYLTTALFFCAGLAGEYPPFASKWFWKAMIPIIIIRCSLVTGLVWLDLAVPYINRMPRALYGFATIILTLEWWLANRIIDASDPSTR